MSDMPTVGLITYNKIPHLTADDQLLVAALRERGIVAAPVVWDDPTVAWDRIQLAVFRSPWDYFHRYDEFMSWLDRAESMTSLWNPAPLVRWNSHKRYLLDLAAQGIPIVPTIVLMQGTSVDIATLLAEQGWDHAVVKPAVSGSAYGALLVQPTTVVNAQRHLDEMLAGHDMLVQPYLPTVAEYGERSLVFIAGTFSHAARKDPALTHEEPSGRDTGGFTQAVEAAQDEIALATRVLATLTHPVLYTRVDTIRNAEGTPLLMELEAIEPSLYLRLNPLAAERLAEAIIAKL